MKRYIIKKSLFDNFKIEEIETISETDKTYTISGYNGRVDKKFKDTDYSKFAETLEGAKAMRILIIDDLISTKESNIFYLKNEIEKLQKAKTNDSTT